MKGLSACDIRLCFFILLLCSPGVQLVAQEQASWRTKTRLQTSYEFDDNIRENPNDSLGLIKDSSVRFIFHSKATRRAAKSRLAFEYQGGLQTYFQNSLENKLINEIKASTLVRLGRLQLGARGNGRLKIYLSDVLDYASGNLEVFVRPPAFTNLQAEIGVKTDGITYQNHSIFDFSAVQVSVALSRKLTPGLSLRLALTRGTRSYNRLAQVFNSEIDNLRETRVRQKDESWQLRSMASYSRGFVINLTYMFQHLDSNSFGYTFNRHQVSVVFGVPLSRKTWLRGFGAVQIKNYAEDSQPILTTDLDTERDESNFLIIDLSRDLTDNLTAIARFATYRNESVTRDLFYRKSLLTLGFDFRL